MTTGHPDGLLTAMVQRGMSRRTFLKFSAAMAATLALPVAYAPRIAAAVSAAPRIPVIWLRGQTCGGETRAFLQASEPTTAELLLDLLSIDYQAAIMARSGASAELARVRTMETAPNGYFAVVEGAIPLADGGVYSTIGGRTFQEVVREVCGGALATIAVGSCAFDGGVPAASGGVTQAAGIERVVPGIDLVNLPGCPINVANLTATVVHYLTFKTLPATDARHRPLFAYGGLIHNQCERRAHFEFGEFVQAWGDEGAQKGWCLYKMGCKGPETDANCPTVRFAEGTSWPVRAGAGCIGCVMPGAWDAMGPAYARLPSPIPFAPSITADQLGLTLVGAVGAVTVAHGAASSVRARHRSRVARSAAVAEAPVEAAIPATGEAAAAPIEPVKTPAAGAETSAAAAETPPAAAGAEAPPGAAEASVDPLVAEPDPLVAGPDQSDQPDQPAEPEGDPT